MLMHYSDFSVLDNCTNCSLSEDSDRIINTDLFFSDYVTGIILFIEGYSVSILKEYSNRQVVYAFDSHSRDSEGIIVPDGTSILIKFSSIKSFWDYIVLIYASSSCQLVYIKTIPRENKTNMEKSLAKFKRSKLYYENLKEKVVSRKESSRKFYEKNSAEIKGNRKRCYQENAEQKKENQKRHYQNNSEQKKDSRKKRYQKNGEQEKEIRKKRYQKQKLNEEKSENLDPISNIQASSIKRIENEGPFFICVCCNRCLYKRSVILFSENRYLESGFCPKLHFIPSFDYNLYICKTCDKKILKHMSKC